MEWADAARVVSHGGQLPNKVLKTLESYCMFVHAMIPLRRYDPDSDPVPIRRRNVRRERATLRYTRGAFFGSTLHKFFPKYSF